MPKQKRPFKVEIEAQLEVMAWDEQAATKKVIDALNAERQIAPDVTSAALWVYGAYPSTSGFSARTP